MNIVKSVLRIGFEEATHPWLELRGLLRVATGDEKGELRSAPIVINRNKEKKRIVIQVRSMIMEHETDGTIEQSNEEAISILEHFHEVSPFPKVAMLRQDVVFIEPTDRPFYELVNVVKQHYLRPTAISDPATDLTLVFDQHEEGGTLKQVQIGPMDKAQLQQAVLRWPMEGLPEAFIFMGLGYEVNGSEGFSVGALQSFLRDAISWRDSLADSLIEDLKGGAQW